MKLYQSRHFQPATNSPCKLTIFSRRNSRINFLGLEYKLRINLLTDEFSTQNTDVELDIVTDQQRSVSQIVDEKIQNFSQFMSFLQGTFCRDSMYLFRFIRDIESFRFNNIVVLRDQFPLAIMKLPG